MKSIMPTVLEKIARSTRRRVDALAATATTAGLMTDRQPLDFAAAFAGPGLHVIAEVKLASPSAGSFGDNLDPLAIAFDYGRNGATALSVLTEPEYFHGDISYLAAIRPHASLPLLMKDFFLDERQLDQAYAAGADCILLIVSMLERKQLSRLLAASKARGLSALVEVHDEEELHIAIETGARIIGINNRNLHTLTVSLDVSRKLGPLARELAPDATLICESGIKTNAEMRELAALGFNGFLVGTTLVRSGRPGEMLAQLLAPADDGRSQR